MKRGAFLDRDGTIVLDRGFMTDPDQIELIDGAALAIRRLVAADFKVFVVTNQSGIARGLITPIQYQAVAARVEELLRAADARVDATYYCPHHPAVSGPCECRKPGLGHYRHAAAGFGVDLASSVYIGDRVTDLLPALATGGRGILVLTGEGATAETEAAELGFEISRALPAAVDLVIGPD